MFLYSKLPIISALSGVLIGSATYAIAAQTDETKLRCATCHAVQAQSQASTSMAHALQLPSLDPLFETHPKLSFRHEIYSYAIERRGSDVIYSVTDGSNSISLPVRYVFGVGSQTFVLERGGHFYESLVSYYPTINALDITIGGQHSQAKTVLEAMGRDLPADQAADCFGCHSTGAVVDGTLKLESMKPGVRCEHCHTGANEHLQAISHGKLDSVPPKLKSLSAEDISNFCGQCHRTWETVVRNHWRGEINVRFQPYRLANSKCFDGIDRRMSCIGCHDPHQEIVRDEKTYDSKCLACHTAGAKPSAGMLATHDAQAASTIAMKICPVSKSDCVSCHMPKIQLPGGHMIFRDHEVRIVHANEPYPN